MSRTLIQAECSAGVKAIDAATVVMSNPMSIQADNTAAGASPSFTARAICSPAGTVTINLRQPAGKPAKSIHQALAKD
jgi:hypothetical protein